MVKDVNETQPVFSDIYHGRNPITNKFMNHRNEHFPIRTGLAAISLFALGSILLYVAFAIGWDDERRGLSLFILGLLCFIPGSYASFQLYGAYKGWRNYHYGYVPSYDD